MIKNKPTNQRLNRYLESRHQVQTESSVKQWIKKSNSSQDRMLFGIFHEDLHVGNLTFYMIDEMRRCLRIGIVIGRKQMHRQGFAAEALRAAIKYVFDVLKFKRIEAGVYPDNQASINLFQSVELLIGGTCFISVI